MLFFALLIHTLAYGQGVISYWLSARWLVFLGEISFSIYMTHQILNRAWDVYFGFLQGLPNAVECALFWIVLLSASAAMYMFIEAPAREAIMRAYDRRNSKRELYVST